MTQALESLAAGDLRASAATYQQARNAAPQSAGIPHRMGLALSAAGLAQDALVQHIVAERLAPNEARYRRALAAVLVGANLAKGSAAVMESLCRLLAAPDVRPQELASAAWSLLDERPAVRHLWLALESPDFATVEACMLEPAVQQQLAEPLLQLLLARTQALTPERERALTALRRFALRAAAQPRLAWLIAEHPEPLAALALHAGLSDCVWQETAAEEVALSTLAQRIARGTATAQEALLHACYRGWPQGLPWPAGQPPSPMLDEARRRLVEEPAERRRLAAELPELAPCGEDLPPLGPSAPWLAAPLPEPQPLAAFLRDVFPEQTVPIAARPRLLIVGCGTGEAALAAAARFVECEVTAVDSDRSVLAYAQQRAQALGLHQIAFAVADPLALGGLPERFDLIDARLIRLADPAGVWRTLRPLLNPGGLMRLGLRSRLGTEPLTAVRRALGAWAGVALDAAVLRRWRHWLFENRSRPEAAFVLSLPEAWHLDELRGLMSFGRRHHLALPEIAALLDEMNLAFLGFEFYDPRTLAQFREQHPATGAERDLALWQSFEEARPGSFAALYRFWCRARDD